VFAGSLEHGAINILPLLKKRADPLFMNLIGPSRTEEPGPCKRQQQIAELRGVKNTRIEDRGVR